MTDRVKATFLVPLIFASGIVLGGILACFLAQPRFPGSGRGSERPQSTETALAEPWIDSLTCWAWMSLNKESSTGF